MMTKTQQIIAGLLKTGMHGYPDYQMTDPITAPLPQQSLPNYEPEDQEAEVLKRALEKGLLSKQAEELEEPSAVPWKWMMGGGTIGGMTGKQLMEGDMRQSDLALNFLKGKPNPRANAMLLQALQEERVLPSDIPAYKQNLSNPEWIKQNLFPTPQAYEDAISHHRGEYWKAMGKGPGLGTLAGAATGLGAGLLYNHLFDKESSERGLLWKEAFRAPPPDPESQRVPSAWTKYQSKGQSPRVYGHAAFAPTHVGAHPFEQTQIAEVTGAHRPMAMAARKPMPAPGLLSKAKGLLGGVASIIGKRPRMHV